MELSSGSVGELVRSGTNRTVSIDVPSVLNQVGDSISQASDSTRPKDGHGLEEVSNEIFFLERETADLGRQYKELLARSQESGSVAAISTLRSDLNNISRVLEERNEKLFELKKQQQLALKSF